MFTFCVMALGPLSLLSPCSISLCRLFVLITEFPALTPSLLSPIHDHKTEMISVFMIQGSYKSYPRNQNYWFGGDDDMIDTQVSSCRWPLLLEDALSSPALSAASTSSASPGIWLRVGRDSAMMFPMNMDWTYQMKNPGRREYLEIIWFNFYQRWELSTNNANPSYPSSATTLGGPWPSNICPNWRHL